MLYQFHNAYKMKTIARIIMKKHQILYKIIITILIFSIIFESSATQVLASGLDFELTDGENSNAIIGDDDNSDNSNSGSDIDSDNNDSNSDNYSDNSNSDNSSSDSDNNPDNSGSDSDNNPDNSGSDSDNGNPDSEEDSVTDSDNDATNLDENEKTEEIELNELDKESTDDEISEAIANSEKAFKDILSNKDVMALVYLTDVYHVRSLADEKSNIVADIESGHTVYLLGVTITKEAVWYKVNFWLNGSLDEGYVERGYLAYSDEEWIKWDEEYLYELADKGILDWSVVGGISSYAASYADVAQFPAGYQSALTQLKSLHSNWTFVPMDTKLDFETAVSNEMGDKSLIQNTTSNASKGWVGKACPSESGWYYATKDAVSYCMDPRNFLTETYVFQFEQLTFNSSYHTEAAIQTFLNSTFMKGTLPDDSKNRTYAKAFYEIGSSRKLSPIHLASRVYQEQGQGNSGLISGTYPGYEGYYNYFNVNVNGGSDTEKIVKGLTYAKQMGWNTRYKSLEGGAATIGNNYILKGQDTLYLEKFNVNSNSPYGIYNHQYMQNIQAPASESASTKKMYSNTNSLNSPFVFKIPVYNNMPGLKLNKTNVKIEKGNTITLTASVNGTAVPSGDVTWTSSNTAVASVSDDGTVTAVNPGTATISASYDGNEAQCTVVVINPLRQITLDKDEVTLRRPDTVVKDTGNLSNEELSSNISSTELKVSFDPEDTTDDKTIIWSSSNKKVATVDNGIVTAVGTGEATITAKASKAGNKTAKCKVTVIAPVYKIEFSSDNNTDKILTGQVINLSVNYLPLDTTSDTTVIWESSDTSVASVARTRGSVKGISAGNANITATIGGYSASHSITVEDCTMTFMDSDNNTILKTFSTAYGDKIPEEAFPIMEDTDDSIFIGWYTGINGTGSRFNKDSIIHQKETTVFPYYQPQGKGFYAIPIGDQTYTGSAIKPEILVYDSIAYNDGTRELYPLESNKDYTVSYKNNKKAASSDSAKAPSITVKGKGNYAGTETITFNILPKALTDSDITVDNVTSSYTGKVIKGRPTVYHNGKKLTLNTDYKLTYPQTGAGAYRNAGTYQIVITGIGSYTGSLTVYETITQKVLLSKVSIAKISNQSYDPSIIDAEQGKGIEPTLTVTYKRQPLKESTDGGKTGNYVVSYKNNFKTGTATATITAVDNDENPYAGSKSINFKITATSINKASITGVIPKTHTGNEADVKQDGVLVTLAGTTLQESNDNGKTGDYITEYKNIDRTGTATLIIKGINKYTGTKKQTYKISACDLSKAETADISLSYSTETPYVKGGAKPNIFLSYKGKELISGKDYTVKYKNNNAVTTANMPANKLPMVIINGKGIYKGQVSGSFTITDGAMSENGGKITMTANDVIYKSKKGAYKTSVTLTDINGKKLAAGKDYSKAFKYTYVNQSNVTTNDGAKVTRNAGDDVNENDIPNVGTAIRITVTGSGNYAGTDASASISAVYHVVSANISKAKVTVSPKEYNNGKEVTLTEDDITVTMNGAKLHIGNDYEIDETTYTNNYKKGKASVIIKGTGGNYGGSKKITFSIKGKIMSWWK